MQLTPLAPPVGGECTEVGVPCCLFRVYYAGPNGQRSGHQMLATFPSPQALLQECLCEGSHTMGIKRHTTELLGSLIVKLYLVYLACIIMFKTPDVALLASIYDNDPLANVFKIYFDCRCTGILSDATLNFM